MNLKFGPKTDLSHCFLLKRDKNSKSLPKSINFNGR